MSEPRSVFQTKTGRSAIAAAAAAIITVATPHVADIIERHAKVDPRDVQSIESLILGVSGFFGVGGAFGAIAGRASATDKVSSPDWMPGHNENELKQTDDLNLS